MKKIMNMAGALTIAVALASMTTACSNDDSFVETENTIQTQRTVQFSINATIGNEGATRAVVETNDTKHTLKFGTGDKLFVSKQVVVGGVARYVRGMLSATSIASDGKSATFTGSITLPEGYTSDFGPEGAVATLIPANGENNFVITDGDNLSKAEWKGGASQDAIDDAIAKYSYAKGTLDNTGAVTLESGSAFLKCSITGLEAAVKCYAAAVMRDGKMIACGSVKSDENGKADFVAWIETSTTSQAYTLELYYMDKKHSISIGSRAVAAKVYNVTKTAGEEVYNSFEILKQDGSVYEKPDWQTVYGLTTGTYYIKGNYSTLPVRVDGNNTNLILNSASLASYSGEGIGLKIGGTTTLTLNGESYFSGSNYSIYAGSNFTVNGKGILKSKIYTDDNVSNVLVDGGATVNVPQGYFYMKKDDATLTIDGGSTVNILDDLGYSGCTIPNIIIKKGTFKYVQTQYTTNNIGHIYGPDGTTDLTTYTTEGYYHIYTVN